jgi:hypothetical protein
LSVTRTFGSLADFDALTFVVAHPTAMAVVMFTLAFVVVMTVFAPVAFVAFPALIIAEVKANLRRGGRDDHACEGKC